MNDADPDAPCWVYIFARRDGDGFSGPVKVGIAADTARRLKTIQTACPHPLVTFYIYGCPDRATALGLERAFHVGNRARRTSGEWFDMDPMRAVRWLLLQIALDTLTRHGMDKSVLKLVAPDDDLDIEPQLIARLDALP